MGCNNNKQLTQQEQQAQQIVAQCVTKGDLLTHNGRTAILNCIAPKGHEQAFQACAAPIVASPKWATKSGRQDIYGQLATCLEKNR